MNFYQHHVLPRLLAMRQEAMLPFRRRVIGAAEGRVLEIGVGSGLNLPLYGLAVREVIGLDPSPELLLMAHDRAAAAPVPVKLLGASAEGVPLDDASIDTVVTTWTLCTIPDAPRALAELRRVLLPGGVLLFVERPRAGAWCHGTDRRLRSWLHPHGFAEHANEESASLRRCIWPRVPLRGD